MPSIQEQLKHPNTIMLNVRLLEASGKLGNKFPLTTWDQETIVLSIDVELEADYAYYTWSYLYPGDDLSVNASAIRFDIEDDGDRSVVDQFNRLVFSQALGDVHHASFSHAGLGTFVEF